MSLFLYIALPDHLMCKATTGTEESLFLFVIPSTFLLLVGLLLLILRTSLKEVCIYTSHFMSFAIAGLCRSLLVGDQLFSKQNYD